LRFAVVSEPDQPMINVLGQVMFAVHVEQHARPDPAFGKQIAKWLHPHRFDEEKVQAPLGAMPLDAMNEQIIRVQLVGHYHVINPRHGNEYLAGERRLSIVPTAALGLRALSPGPAAAQAMPTSAGQSPKLFQILERSLHFAL
jgi:hypothetical protein